MVNEPLAVSESSRDAKGFGLRALARAIAHNLAALLHDFELVLIFNLGLFLQARVQARKAMSRIAKNSVARNFAKFSLFQWSDLTWNVRYL